MADKPNVPYKKKGRVYTYEEWSPYAGKSPLYVQELTQQERIKLIRDTTSPEEFPQRLARISSEFPGMSVGAMVGMAQVGANDDVVQAVARLDTLQQSQPVNIANQPRTNMVTAGGAGYDYLHALGKNEDTASEADKQDAWWFAGLKGATRYLTSGLYSGLQLVTNTARQLDAAYNVWADKGQVDKGPVQAGEKALDFTQIVKDTYLYQNLVEGKSLGQGYFPGGDAVAETERIAAQIATVNGKAYTPGRAIEGMVGIDPGERGYGVVSGIIDGIIALRLDPAIIAGRLKIAKDAAARQAKVQEGTVLAGKVRQTFKDAEEQARKEIRELSRVRAKEARDALKLNEKELIEEQKRIVEEIRTYDRGIAEGKLAVGDKRVELARKRAGVDSLYEQRDRLVLQLDSIKPKTVDGQKIPGELIRDAGTNKLLSEKESIKFVNDQIKKVDQQIDNALSGIYVQNNSSVYQMLSRTRDELLAKSDEYTRTLAEIKDPVARQKLIEERRAGLLTSTEGFRTNIEDAKRYIADGNADELFQAIADEVSPSAIMKLSNNKFDAILAGQLAKADNINDVEKILLSQIGLKVMPDFPRGITARYIADPVKTAVRRVARPVTKNEKIVKVSKFLFDKMPTGRAIQLQDTIALTEETRRWMVAARYSTDDINKVLDEIILSDERNYQVRQQIIINMLKATGNKYKAELNLPSKVKNELDRALTAYSSELSGLRQYSSESAGDIYRKKFVVNGKTVDLSGTPTSIAELASEIVLPDVYKLRELTGNLAKVTRWVDNKIAKDAAVAEKTAFAASKYTRALSDGFLRQILLAYRGAYIARNVLEMQVRSFLAGGMNVFTNPVATISMVLSNKQIASKVSQAAAKIDPYKVDVNGKAFMSQDVSDFATQDIFNSFAHTMAERGFANDGRSIRDAVRSGNFTLMPFNGTNAPEYAEALAYRLLMHHADPMKRAIVGKKLPGKYQKLVATGKMEFEDAFIQAVRDGAFKNQIDILNKSVPELRKLLSTDEGMRVLFFKGGNSYLNEVVGETLGNVEWKNFVATGKVTIPTKKSVLDPETNKMVEVTEDKVLFELGPDARKNVNQLKNIILDNLVDDSTVEYANALQLSIPAVVGRDLTAGYKKFMDIFFRYAAKVETRTVYGPEYRIAYWNAVSELAPLMSKGAAQKILDGATDIKKTKVAIEQADGTVVFEDWIKRNPAFEDIKTAASKGDGFLSAREIDEYARDRASKHLAGLYYDAVQKKNISYALQLVIPFANAWANTIYKWSELSSSPARLGARITPATRLFNTLQTEESSVIYDVTGTKHDPAQGFIHENAYGDKVFTIPLTGYLRTAFGAFGDPRAADVTIPVNSLNLVAAGASIPGSEIGITPGFGTHINLAYSLLPESLKNSVPPVVANLIAPYGDQSGNPLGIAPAWLRKVIGGVWGTEEARLKFAKSIMAWEVSSNPKYKPLLDGTPLTLEERSELQTELATSAMEQSRFQYLMQGLLQNVSPGTPVYEYYAKNENGDTFFQWQMAQALNKLFEVYDGNYELAIAEYGTMFGRQAIMAAQSASEGVIFADDRAWQFASANPDAFKAYGDVIPYFFVGSDFSTEYKRAMERRGFGKKLSPKELIAEADRMTLAAVKGQLAIEAARNGYGPSWIDEKMEDYKMTTLQGYEPEVTINVNQRAQRILKVESALKRPEFAQTMAGKAAIHFSQARANALKVAAARYPDRQSPSLSGVDNADLRFELELLGQQLSQGNPDFANLFQRVYIPELRND